MCVCVYKLWSVFVCICCGVCVYIVVCLCVCCGVFVYTVVCVCVVVCMHVRVVLCVGVKLCVRCGYLWLHVCMCGCK